MPLKGAKSMGNVPSLQRTALAELIRGVRSMLQAVIASARLTLVHAGSASSELLS